MTSIFRLMGLTLVLLASSISMADWQPEKTPAIVGIVGAYLCKDDNGNSLGTLRIAYEHNLLGRFFTLDASELEKTGTTQLLDAVECNNGSDFHAAGDMESSSYEYTCNDSMVGFKNELHGDAHTRADVGIKRIAEGNIQIWEKMEHQILFWWSTAIDLHLNCDLTP